MNNIPLAFKKEAQEFAQAITTANIPTLLMVLVQLTGALHWLEEPYRLTRARGMGDNDTGGLSDELQREIRQAALEAILVWRRVSQWPFLSPLRNSGSGC